MIIHKSKLTMVILLFFLFGMIVSQNAHSEVKTYIEYGRSIINSHNGHGGVGFVSNKTGWDIGVSILGQGETQRGTQEPAYVYSISKIFPSKYVKFRLGIARSKDVRLIGDTNYKLGIIFLSNEHGEFELTHLSSGGIFDPNTGYDAVVFRLKF